MPQLTEEMKRLMGIAPAGFGGPPVLFQKGEFSEGGKAPVREVKEFSPFKPEEPVELHEGTMRLFKSVKEQMAALERASKLVQRVNASILRDRKSSNESLMNERCRAEMYRLDQEVATAMDSIRAAQEALESIQKEQKVASRMAREARRQGRR
jgi:hypothetical protein